MTTENSALMEALEPTWANRELANVIRNLMHQGGWGLDTDAHDWRSDHPLLQTLAALSRATQSSGDGEALRIGWWNDMRQRGVSQDVAIQKIMGALASFPAPLPAEREADGEAARQFDRIKDIERAMANGAHYADDPECHPCYPVLVASRQILEELFAALSASAQPVSERGEGREGPAPIPNTRLQCFGCKNLHTEDWSEPSGDGETFDNGTTARCKAVPTEHGGEVIRSYWSRTDEAPKWCPFLPAAPQTDGGKA